jgi:hypothetical protein
MDLNRQRLFGSHHEINYLVERIQPVLNMVLGQDAVVVY